jgi:hypothetical protein
MKPGLCSRFKVGLALGTGALLALMLCVQCVRTYLYTDAVLIPQQAQPGSRDRRHGALQYADDSAPAGRLQLIGAER